MIMKVKAISRSRSFQGQGHSEVIPESDCNCLDFYPEAGCLLLPECFLIY